MYEFTHSDYSLCCAIFQPNLVGAEDEVPLLVAASNGDTPLLKLLVNHRADVNVQVS